MGDVRLAALAGLLLGTRGWAPVVGGAGLPYVIVLPFAVARLRNAGDDRHVPFGPFLIAGALVSTVLTA